MVSVQLDGKLVARDQEIGQGVVIEAGAEIICDRVEIGDFTTIASGTRIICPEFRVGEYTKIHRGCLFHGYKPMRLGHNCWIGEHTVLDSIGGLTIGNNVGIGAHSQVWTHAQHGDIVEGCRFHHSREVTIEDDVWLVGHCISSAARLAERSMVMAGSVVTHNTEPNHVYAGVPAVDITDKIGCQFGGPSVDEKLATFSGLVAEFEQRHPEFTGRIRGCDSWPGNLANGVSYFNVTTRQYTKRYGAAEITFRRETPLVRMIPRN